MRRKAIRAFTSVEVLIVSIILAILAVLIIPQFLSSELPKTKGEVYDEAARAAREQETSYAQAENSARPIIPGPDETTNFLGVYVEIYGDNLLFIRARGVEIGGLIKAYCDNRHLELISSPNIDNNRHGYWVVVRQLAKVPAESPPVSGKQ